MGPKQDVVADRSRYHGGYTALICDKGKCRPPYVVEGILNPPSREAAASADCAASADTVEGPKLVDT